MDTLSLDAIKTRRDIKLQNFNFLFSLTLILYSFSLMLVTRPLSVELLVAIEIIVLVACLNFIFHLIFLEGQIAQTKIFYFSLMELLLVILATTASGGLGSPFIYLFTALILLAPTNLVKTRSFGLTLVAFASLFLLFFLPLLQLSPLGEIRTFLGLLSINAIAFAFSTIVIQDYYTDEDEKLFLTQKLLRELQENEKLAKDELEKSKEINNTKHLSDTYKAIDSLKGVLNYETLVSLIPYSLNSLFGFDQSFLFKEENGRLVLKSLSVGASDKEKLHKQVGSCVGEEKCFKEIIDLGQIKEITDLAEELKNSKIGTTWIEQEHLKQAVVIPLRIGNSLFGCLVAARKEPRDFEQNQDTLGIFATTVVLGLENANFYSKARETSEQYDAILTQMDSGVAVTDKDNKVTLLNTAGGTLLGFDGTEVIGKSITEVVRTFDDKGVKLAAKNDPVVLAEEEMGKSFTKDTFIETRTEDRFPASLSAKAIKDDKGKKIGLVIVFRDITKEIEIEKTRNEFISIASHELRTPMTAIKGFLSMVIGNEVGKVPPKALEFLKMAQEGNERLIRLVEDLLNVSRIEGGRIQIIKEEVDLTEVTKTVISDLLYHAGSNGVLINFAPDKNLPKVIADHDKLREVLINLIGNAIKYTDKGGKVTVEQKLSGWKIVTSVTDTGIGIPKNELPNLFKKFYRVPNEMTMKREGTGLGLYITKQIVELMEGELKVSSIEHQGSTFSFTLQLAKQDQKIVENKPVEKKVVSNA